MPFVCLGVLVCLGVCVCVCTAHASLRASNECFFGSRAISKSPCGVMAQPSLQELRSRKHALVAEVSDVRAATRKVQRTENGKAVRTAREWVLQKAAGGKGRLRCEALAVYVLADFAPEPVVVLMRAVGRRKIRW